MNLRHHEGAAWRAVFPSVSAGLRSGPGPRLRSSRSLPLQPGHQIVELIDDRQDRVGLAQIDAGLPQQLHRIVAAAGAEQRQVAVARVRLLLGPPCMI